MNLPRLMTWFEKKLLLSEVINKHKEISQKKTNTRNKFLPIEVVA
jgi:hypothetical protein